MTRPIRTTRRASVELTAEVQWYQKQRPGLGVEFLDVVVTALNQVANHPGRSRTVSEAQPPGLDASVAAGKIGSTFQDKFAAWALGPGRGQEAVALKSFSFVVERDPG